MRAVFLLYFVKKMPTSNTRILFICFALQHHARAMNSTAPWKISVSTIVWNVTELDIVWIIWMKVIVHVCKNIFLKSLYHACTGIRYYSEHFFLAEYNMSNMFIVESISCSSRMDRSFYFEISKYSSCPK